MSGSCRQREILRYFGETDGDRCGHCDNCRKHEGGREMGARGGGRGTETSGQWPVAGGQNETTGEQANTASFSSTDFDSEPNSPVPRPPSPAANPAPAHDPILNVVRIVLSGVVRTQSRFSCGKNLIAQMLCGSGSAKVAEIGPRSTEHVRLAETSDAARGGNCDRRPHCDRMSGTNRCRSFSAGRRIDRVGRRRDARPGVAARRVASARLFAEKIAARAVWGGGRGTRDGNQWPVASGRWPVRSH